MFGTWHLKVCYELQAPSQEQCIPIWHLQVIWMGRKARLPGWFEDIGIEALMCFASCRAIQVRSRWCAPLWRTEGVNTEPFMMQSTAWQQAPAPAKAAVQVLLERVVSGSREPMEVGSSGRALQILCSQTILLQSAAIIGQA